MFRYIGIRTYSHALISTASPCDSMKFVEVTTGHYSSERVALLFKPGTYAAGSEKADCFGGLLLAVVFSLFFFSKVFNSQGGVSCFFFKDEVFKSFF